MKKHIVNIIGIITVFTMIAFLLFAFVLNQINPFAWEMCYRSGLVAAVVCIIIFVSLIYGAVNDIV